MNESAPWLQTLKGALEDLEAVPLWGNTPSFPWKDFATHVSELFELNPVEISLKGTESLPAGDWMKGLGTSPLIQSFHLTPLPGHFYWAMPKQSQQHLLEAILTKEPGNKGFSDESLQQGFYKFICLNVLDLFNRLNVYGNLTAALSDEEQINENEEALGIDIAILAGTKRLWGRLLCPQSTLAGFKSHFSTDATLNLEDPKIQNIPLTLTLDIGKTTLSVAEWDKVKMGDLVLLDRCTFDLKNNRGRGTLSLGDSPFLEARIKGDEVKIIEHALYKEVTTMNELPPDEDYPEAPLEGETEEPLWSEGEEKEASGGSNDQFISKTQIPLTLTVEVGRLQMPLHQLLQLQPGNVLNLSVNTASGVHLTVGGKRVAKGELIQVGDGIGVKILKVGE